MSPGRRAFTLMELMVVIAIVLVLAAISFPLWQGAKRSALERQTASNLRQVWLALELYRDQNDGAGKVVGSSSELGLPLAEQYLRVEESLRLEWFQGGRLVWGNCYYPWDPAEREGRPEDFFKSRTEDWTTQNRKFEDKSVLVGNFNHTVGCSLVPDDRCLALGLGVRLNGAAVRATGTGSIYYHRWWDR